jgi:adenylate cyclase
LIYHFEDYCLDIARSELRRGNMSVEIEPQVFDLLHYLVEHRDRVVSKDDLIAGVWRGRIVSESTLTSRITAARQAVGDSGGEQRLIRTIARKGVRFVGEVRTDTEPPSRATPVSTSLSPPMPDKPSIAVLPFDNMSSDAEQQFFADGVAEDIITALSRFPSLFVIARNSSFTFKVKPVNVSEVGRALGVRYVLEGSLRKSGNRVRVTAQLIESESGNHVWAERYDRDIADIFAVQDEITAATSAAIAPAIAAAEQQRAMRKQPASLDAWGHYQRGLWHLGKGAAAETELAKSAFEQAIAADPMFAGGYVGVSAVLSRAKGTQSEEEALARRAVALDGGNAEAHARLSLALLAGGDHDGARAEAELSLSICPNLAAGFGALGVTLAYADEPRRGLEALEACLRLDPRGPSLVNRMNQVALAHYFCRDYAAAAEAARRAIRAYPDFPSPYRWLAAALGQLGLTKDAKEALDQAIRLSSSEFEFQVVNRPRWFRPKDHELMREGLRRAGWRDARMA